MIIVPWIVLSGYIKTNHCFTFFSFFQVATLNKADDLSGLGISLEGTVDVEDGKEVRPHHYIRSILPEGPVGKHGKLVSGDELLEVLVTRFLEC